MTRGFLFGILGLVMATWASAREDGRLRYAADEVAARRVQAMLDDQTWTQVVRIANDRPSRALPAVTWATVFELGDRLWIYLPHDGTLSLSVYEGHLDQDKADLSEVLRHLERGLIGYEVVADDGAAQSGASLWAADADPAIDLPNSCFVRSVAWFQRLRATGIALKAAHLLLYYGGSGPTRWGHTVLCFQTAKGWFVWDPNEPTGARLVEGGDARDALAMARRVSPGTLRNRVDSARRFGLPMNG